MTTFAEFRLTLTSEALRGASFYLRRVGRKLTRNQSRNNLIRGALNLVALLKLSRQEWETSYRTYLKDCRQFPDWMQISCIEWLNMATPDRVCAVIILSYVSLVCWLVRLRFPREVSVKKTNYSDRAPPLKIFIPIPDSEIGGCARSDSTVPAI